MNRKESENERLALSQMSETLNKMKQNLYEQQQKEEKERLRMIEERRRQMQLQAFLHEKEDCLQSSMEMGANINTETSETKIIEESDKNLKKMISGTGDLMLTEAEKQRILMEHSRIEQLNAQKELNQHLEDLLIQTTVGFEQLLDTKDCYNDELMVNSRKYISHTCAQMFAAERPPPLQVSFLIQKILDCSDITKFCATCCNKYIGGAHIDSRFACTKKCKDKMNSKGPSVVVPVSRVVMEPPDVLSFIQKMKLKELLRKSYQSRATKSDCEEDPPKTEKKSDPVQYRDYIN